MADGPDLDPRPVIAHRILHATLDGLLVPVVFHIDEIDDNQARQVAKAELPRQLIGRLEIRLQGGFLDVALAGRSARIDVNGDQRLGLVDDKIATRPQRHLRAVDRVHLLFNLIALKDRQRLFVFLHALHMARDQHLHLCPGFLVGILALDKNLVDLAGIQITDRALDQITFLMDQAGRL